MGYRSQVRSVIYGPKDKMLAFITEQTLIDNSIVFNDFKANLTYYEAQINIYTEEATKDMIVHVLDLYGDGWKWYESYPEVDAWHKLLADAAEAELWTEFTRIGENEDDVVHDSTDDNAGLLLIHRSLGDDINKTETQLNTPF